MGLANNEEIYPNQPLSNVACEARFPGDLQVECERVKFWDRIRDQYPQIEVPKVAQGEALALQGYRFRTPEPDRSVTVALNSLSYSEAKYRGHRLFIEEYLRLAAIFHELFPRVQQLSRFGWRYI
ncbi:MAG TPA: TIGR04255 family protein, partial [Steroidobacteraceae bacterium]